MSLPAHEPDALEKAVRFTCGVLIAAPFGIYLAWESSPLTPSSVGMVVAGALVTGLLALWFGDRFWRVLLRMFHPW